MLKVINTTNQRGSQAKSFSAVSVTGGKDAKTFDITVNVFDVDSTFGNRSIISLFLCGQFVLFGSLDRKSTVLVQAQNTQITFVGKNLDSRANMQPTSFVKSKIMSFSMRNGQCKIKCVSYGNSNEHTLFL